MPIYEFQCESCQHVESILMKISDKAPENCEQCQKGPLRKLISRTSFVLKGQGWYETDFKTKKKPLDDKKVEKETPSSAPETKSEGTKEASPAPKASSSSD